MTYSINDLSPSTSPRFSGEGEHRLSAAVVASPALTGEDRDQMYAVLETYFSGTDRARFEADLGEKEAVILLRDGEGLIQGFSTFMRMELEETVAFFSGDTIIAREYWGDTLLSRTWSRTIFAEAERIVAARPSARVYWFLICSGYKTWRFLPVFFREFFPNAEFPTPPAVQRVLDSLGTAKFGTEYVAREGVVRFRHATPLRPGIADITEQKLRDPRVAFFARMNPGHASGDELACLTEITRANLTRAGERMLS